MRILAFSLVCAYVATIVAGVVHPRAPAWFWTMMMPLVPAAVVVAGFHTWRRLCPIASLASAGARLWRGRRLPAPLRRDFFVVPFTLLVAALVLRHVWMNGDGLSLAEFLSCFALVAFAVNAAFGGKTWCNSFCPVGFVERLYTDGASTGIEHSSCSRCTACRSACPDIDQTRAYERERSMRSRRFCSYAFPGIVFGFYAYFALREGDFGAFFDGAWVARPSSRTLAFGDGFYFLPEVPAVLAVSATLVVFGLMSAALFTGLERVLSARSGDRTRSEHLAQSIAAFVAFSTFYFFAGAPALREHPLLAWPIRFGLGLMLAAWVLFRRFAAPVPDRHRRPPESHRRLLVIQGG